MNKETKPLDTFEYMERNIEHGVPTDDDLLPFDDDIDYLSSILVPGSKPEETLHKCEPRTCPHCNTAFAYTKIMNTCPFCYKCL